MEVVENERDLLKQANKLATLGECFAWMQQCDECIEWLEESSRAKLLQLSIGIDNLWWSGSRDSRVKIQLQRHFAMIIRIQTAVTRRDVWREINTVFKNYIMIGAVINFKHIEPRQFLENASEIVIELVQSIMQEHDNIKINTVFNGKFVTDDKRANKSIATRNYELFRLSDLQEWYESRVVEPTLISLEEFQERDSGWALSRILNLLINVNK